MKTLRMHTPTLRGGNGKGSMTQANVLYDINNEHHFSNIIMLSLDKPDQTPKN